MTARPSTSLDWGGTAIEPTSGQKAAGFDPEDRLPAQWLNFFLQNLEQWAEYLDTEKLPDIVQADADSPLLGSSSTPNDHPSSGSNIWKLWLEMTANDGRKARLYIGDGANGDGWAVTWNARWDAASGTQKWFNDNSLSASSMLLCRGESLIWLGRALGDVDGWTQAEWEEARGQVEINDLLAVDVTASGTVAATGAITGASAAISGDVVAGGDFEYSSPPVVRKRLDIFTGHNLGVSSGSYVNMPPGSAILIPVPVSAGATMGEVRVLGQSASVSITVDISLIRRHGGSLSVTLPSLPTRTIVDTASPLYGPLGSNDDCDWGALATFAGETYYVEIATPGGNADDFELYAIDVEITYPTNRPY